MSARDSSFDDLMVRLRSGDGAAETVVFRRYVHRLIGLASDQFAGWIRNQADVENVVLSAYKSFFRRNQSGEYEVADWDELWALLMIITLHKCTKRRKYLRAARRDVSRQVTLAGTNNGAAWLPDRSPTPEEAAMLTETLEHLYKSMAPADRPLIEHILMGYTALEISERLDCSERTVRRVRQRAKSQLERLLEPERRAETA
jgi:DNA-directed RNA polymerase specialized sigma24 family protein